jgi:hypothetical protein
MTGLGNRHAPDGVAALVEVLKRLFHGPVRFGENFGTTDL